MEDRRGPEGEDHPGGAAGALDDCGSYGIGATPTRSARGRTSRSNKWVGHLIRVQASTPEESRNAGSRSSNQDRAADCGLRFFSVRPGWCASWTDGLRGPHRNCVGQQRSCGLLGIRRPRHASLSGVLPQGRQQAVGRLQICRIQTFDEFLEYRP